MRLHKMVIWLFLIIGPLSLFHLQAQEKILNPNKKKTYFDRLNFDRAIENYHFISKGSMIGGLTFNFNHYDSKDSRLLLNMLGDLNYHINLFGISPYIGYSFKKNQIAGLRLNVNRIDAALGNASLKIDGNTFSLKDLHFKQNMYSVGVFHRSYVGLDQDHRFGLFNETSISLGAGDGILSRGEGDKSKIINTQIVEASIGLSPGLAVFIAQNVSMELSFNVIGLRYRKETQKSKNHKLGELTLSGANFNINLLNMNIGITVCI